MAKGGKKKKRLVEAEGVAHIKATFNNTIITITSANGETIAWSSAGKSGFKGSKKSTPFAATIAAENAAKEAALLLNEAARRSEELRGEGEAEAMRIYGEAYGRDPEFYEFTRTLEAYGTIFGERSTFVIPEDSELLRVLRSVPDAERTLPPERGAGDPSSDG